MPIPLIDTIEPKNNGSFPTHRDVNQEGGYRSVADVTARNAIPTSHRKNGMLVYTTSDGKAWRLGAGLTNADWVEELIGLVGTAGQIVRRNHDGSSWEATSDVVELPIGLSAGDLFYWDGTKLVRVPIGTNGYVFSVVSGVPAWKAADAASSDFGSNPVKTTGAYIQGTSPAATGSYRMGSGGSIVARNAADSVDLYALHSSGDNLYIGSSATNTNTHAVVQVNGTTRFQLSVNSTAYLLGLSNTISTTQPLAGYSVTSTPFRLKRAAITQSSTSDTTLAGAQIECPVLDVSGTPGGAFNIIGPNTADARYEVTNNTASALTIKKSGGAGVTIAAGKSAIVRHNGTDYIRITPDA